MRKAFVIGASGFIGGYMQRHLIARGIASEGSCYKHTVEGLVPLDIGDEDSVHRVLARSRPDMVFLPAANPNVEYCETSPVETRLVNVEGTRHVANACRAIKAKLVYFSSDYIFDGLDGPYDELAVPHPLNIYGQQKFESEKIVTGVLRDAIIARVTVVYGWEKRGKNFVQQLLRSLENGVAMKVPCDQIGSPTYVENLVEMVAELICNDAKGIFNVCGPERIDRYSFARAVAGVFNKNASLILPVKTTDLCQKAARPLSAGMRTEKLCATISVKPDGVLQGLNKMKGSNFDE